MWTGCSLLGGAGSGAKIFSSSQLDAPPHPSTPNQPKGAAVPRQNKVQRGRNLQAFRRARARLKRRQPDGPCWLCGEPIDPTLPYHHAQAWTADHVEPLNTGGPPTGELRPAHRACNSSRGDTTRRGRPPADRGLGTTCREW